VIKALPFIDWDLNLGYVIYPRMSKGGRFWLSLNHSIGNPQMAQMNADVGYEARFYLFKVIHQIVFQISAAIRMDLPSISA